MKNKYRIIIVLLTAILLIPRINTFADTKKENITAEELAEKIYVNLAEYKEIELNDKRTILDDYSVVKYLEEAERQIESNNKSIEQAESKLRSSNISSEEKTQSRYQIEYFKIYNYELQKNKYYYEMQNKLSELYKEYSDKIVLAQKNKLKYDTYKTLCEINTSKFQKEYLKMLLKQRISELTIVQESFKLGYATKNEVLTAKSEYETAKSDLSECESNYNILVKQFEKESGEKLSEFSLPFSVDKKIESEKYLAILKKQSFYDEYYLKQSEIYNEYSNSLDGLVSQMKNEYNGGQHTFLFEDNEEFFDRTYKYISDEQKYYENESEIFKLNSEKYLLKLEVYAAESCKTINALISHRTAKLAEVKVSENSCVIAEGLLKEGRINEVKFNETKIDLKKLKCELVSIETNIMLQTLELDLGANLSNI